MLRRFLKHTRGGIMLETALVLPLLILTFAGMEELTEYLDAMERVNKAVNQTVNVLSSVPNALNIQEDSDLVIAEVKDKIISPYGLIMDIRFCQGGGTVRQFKNEMKSKDGKTGKCGYGSANPPAPTINANCSSGSTGSRGQHITVKAGCSYVPLLNVFGFFDNGITLQTEVSVPMRSIMGW